MKEPKRILVEIHHGFGDIVQMLPVFYALRDKYPNAEICAMVASDQHKDLLGMANIVDEFYILNVHKSIKDALITALKLRKKHFDIGIIAPMSTLKKGKALMALVGCKQVLFDKCEFDENVSQIERALSIIAPLGIDTKFAIPEFKGVQLNTKNNLIGICVGAGAVVEKRSGQIINHYVKNVPVKVVVELSDKLVQNGYKVLLFGGKVEAEWLTPYGAHFQNTGLIENLAGKTTMLESIERLKECRVLIAPDTGLLHIADAIGVENIAYHCASGPQLVGPFSKKSHHITAVLDCQYCYGSEKLYHCINRLCVDNMTSDFLLAATLSVLK